MNLKQAARAVVIAAAAGSITFLVAQRGRHEITPDVEISLALGRPTDHSIALSVIERKAVHAYAEYGTTSGQYTAKTPAADALAGQPVDLTLNSLQPNTRYFYRVQSEGSGATKPAATAEQTFITQRAPGSTFTFGVEGDSHPERDGQMFDAGLYLRTLQHVHAEQPDLYFMLGDDFSIENLIGRGDISQQGVDQIYARQRAFLSTITGSTPLFLVNGNHEEAGGFLLDGTANNPAVYAGNARTKYFPLPAPDGFYTGDAEPVEHIGLLRDYYAWTWGDALFVVIDPYWHSKVVVDAPPGARGPANGDGRSGGGGGERPNGPPPPGGGQGAKQNASRPDNGGGRGNRDLWQVTLGDAQYQWLRTTLEGSHAKYKFVFEHHILGTGRGGIEEADSYEWGGHNRRGDDEFRQKRPGWELPIHALFVKSGVTIYFQGHDHLFAHQQKDGVVYQETPNPADNTYTAFNRDAYRSGDILPNAGHLRVTVSPANVRVDYIRSWLPADETPQHKDGEVAFSYAVPARTAPKN